MALNTKSIFAHGHVRQLLVQALESPNGIQVIMPNKGKAIQLRQKCYTVRRIEQTQNAKMYEPHEPLHGCSIYDELVFDLVPHGAVEWKLRIRNAEALMASLRIEEIPLEELREEGEVDDTTST